MRPFNYVLIGIACLWIAMLARQLGWWIPEDAMTPSIRGLLITILTVTGITGIASSWYGLGCMIVEADRERGESNAF